MGRKKKLNKGECIRCHPNAKERIFKYAKEQNVLEHQKDLINALNRIK